MSPEQQEESQEKKGGGKKKWSFLVLGVFLIVLVAGGYFIAGPNVDSLMALVTDDQEDIHKIQLDTFTINLADDGYRRYIRVDITIECYSEDGIAEIERKKHRIRDQVITMLSQRTVSDFNSDQNFEQVRVGLSDSINNLLSDDTEIKSLYFENFIIQ